MIRIRVLLRWCFVLASPGVVAGLQGQIAIEGVADQGVYEDSVSFRVVRESGYTYRVRLGELTIPAGFFISLDRPDYYELSVHRELSGGGGAEDALVRFIIRASERGNSEWGLSPFVPNRVIPSSPAEFDGAHLDLMIPVSFPAGVPIPVVASLSDAGGDRLRLNGVVRASNLSGGFVPLLRGKGSTRLPAADPGQVLIFDGGLHSLTAVRSVQIDASTSWVEVSGTLSGTVDWGEGARIDVTGDLILEEGGLLTVGAGSVIRLAEKVNVTVNGTLRVEGTTDRPVVFTPRAPGMPWGGLILGTGASLAELTGCVLTGGGGDPNWFFAGSGRGESVRPEQAVLYVTEGATARLTDAHIIWSAGQALHGEGGVLTMTGCLIQGAPGGGQVNGGSVVMNNCHLVEFPDANAPFSDEERDGLHLTGGTHALTNCVVGWAGDDGLDAGEGGGGSVSVIGCWFEGCYHEGMGWSAASGIRQALVRDTVVLNCGQGIEAGAGIVDVRAEHVLCADNEVGVRFGDNQALSYDGLLRVTNSFLLGNTRDVWGRTWDDWQERLGQMEVRGNLLSGVDGNHPDNGVWQSATDGLLLNEFCPGDPGVAVGVGFASPEGQFDLSLASGSVRVGLSCFRAVPVSVDYEILTDGVSFRTGTVTFLPGEISKLLSLGVPSPLRFELIQVVLRGAAGAEITGNPLVLFLSSSPGMETLISQGSEWSYLDDGSDQGSAWFGSEFDDGAWLSGPAPLGYGNGDEATEVSFGPSVLDKHITTYFRRRFDVSDPSKLSSLNLYVQRDDAALVYINGVLAFRDGNLPAGAVTSETLANFALGELEETVWLSRNPSIELLREGGNVVAAEIHQADPASSDILFDLELTARASPTIQLTLVGGQLVLYWNDPSFLLEESVAVEGPWVRSGSGASPQSTPFLRGRRFYRLRQL